MRISTLLAIFIFISSTLFAQQKGNLLLGGSLGFSKIKNESVNDAYTQTGFSLRPSVGTFYKNNRMFGVSLLYSHSKYRDTLSDNTYGAGIFLRQYQPLGKSFYLFLEEGINGYSSTNNYVYDPADTKTKQKSLSLNFFPGIAYAINKRFQLELGLPELISINYVKQTYDNMHNTPATHNKTSNFTVNTGFTEDALGYLTFGMKWMLAKN